MSRGVRAGFVFAGPNRKKYNKGADTSITPTMYHGIKEHHYGRISYQKPGLDKP